MREPPLVNFRAIVSALMTAGMTEREIACAAGVSSGLIQEIINNEYEPHFSNGAAILRVFLEKTTMDIPYH